PFYLEYTRLGGPKRKTPLNVEDLTIEDLEIVMADVRQHTGDIYGDVYDEYARVLDINRALHPSWIDRAHTELRAKQESLIAELEEKLSMAAVETDDEFMYQSKSEVEHELEAARQLLSEIPENLTEESLVSRVWNSEPYKRYRGADEE